MAIKYVAAPELSLQEGATRTQTTLKLEQIIDRAGNTLTMSDFGDIGYMTLEPGRANMELISFTGISGTTLTGVTRGLKFVGDYTGDSDLRKPHSSGVEVIVSNPPQLYDELTAKSNDEEISGGWTFSGDIPKVDTYVAPTLEEELSPKKYVDDVALAGAPDATTTVKGVAELATAAELAAGTATGGTGANLVAASTNFNDTSSATRLVPVTGTDGKLDQGFLDLSENFTFTGEVDIDTATNFKLGGTAYTGTMADLNEASDFFQATDITGAEAETLTSGATSDASLLHYHSSVQSKLSEHADNYIHVPIVLAAVKDSTPDVYTNFLVDATGSSNLEVHSAMTRLEADSGGIGSENVTLESFRSLTTSTSGSQSADGVIPDGDYDMSKRFRLAFSVGCVDNTDPNDFFIGFRDSAIEIGIKFEDNLVKSVVDDGTTENEQTLVTGFTNDLIYNFMIIRDDSEIRFYIDGVLENTVSSNLPASGDVNLIIQAVVAAPNNVSIINVGNVIDFWYDKTQLN